MNADVVLVIAVYAVAGLAPMLYNYMLIRRRGKNTVSNANTMVQEASMVKSVEPRVKPIVVIVVDSKQLDSTNNLLSIPSILGARRKEEETVAEA